MSDFKYTLEPGSKKHKCVECGQKTFVRYLHSETLEHLPEEYGRCDREVNCGYHLNPYKTGFGKQSLSEFHHASQYNNPRASKTNKEVQRQMSTIPIEYVQKTMSGYDRNNFSTFLEGLFGRAITSELIGRYFLGTSKHWPGATVFWQIDNEGKVRAGKVMGYIATNGRRVKEPVSQITWVHSLLKGEKELAEFNLKQCFFGEHLFAKAPCKPIAIVEAEKTAIIASIFFPEFTWLANWRKKRVRPSKFITPSYKW
ncbi:DUF6371 domain-containing protein [Flavitalea sp.]|nr:DUF6371 domain-containing protein [Flavitalea sp.]